MRSANSLFLSVGAVYLCLPSGAYPTTYLSSEGSGLPYTGIYHIIYDSELRAGELPLIINEINGAGLTVLSLSEKEKAPVCVVNYKK